MFDKLSEELKAARIRAGLTLQQLATKTRIDLKFLEYLEDGNFSFLPELYVKAFLKEYARFVAIDEKVILKKYEAYKAGKEYAEPQPETIIDKIKELKESKFEKAKETPQTKPIPPYNSPSDEQENPFNAFFSDKKNVVLIGAAAGVLVLFLAIWFLFIHKSSDIVVERPYEEVVNESKSRYTEDEPGTAAQTDSLKLTITATDTCWVKVLIDSSRNEEFKLYPHNSKQVSAGSNFKLTLGNSFRVQLNLNNKPLNLDAKTKVSYVYIDSKGISNLNPPPKPKQQ
jgi:cytoskeletal protein RodZ